MVYTLSTTKILLVEDVPPMRALTASLLKIFGFRDILLAENGEEAFSLFKKDKPDLVITDWFMEPVDGMELIRKIRQSPESPDPYVPIILMTGFSGRAHIEEGRDSGMTEFLLKPFNARDLYSRIAQIIEKPRQFVDINDFFGPDRRRRRNVPHKGTDRRALPDRVEAEFESIEVDQIIRDIKDTLKKM
ncbi:MAG: response regulator [Alphaproteobacteria bacterium]|nr:response regulator [Alphaproteobacteria bacterium]